MPFGPRINKTETDLSTASTNYLTYLLVRLYSLPLKSSHFAMECLQWRPDVLHLWLPEKNNWLGVCARHIWDANHFHLTSNYCSTNRNRHTWRHTSEWLGNHHDLNAHNLRQLIVNVASRICLSIFNIIYTTRMNEFGHFDVMVITQNYLP